MEPGHCVFDASWAPSPLLKREWVSHDTAILTFALTDQNKPLGLSTCACLLMRSGRGDAAIVRPYTPVSTNALNGAFELLVKIYPDGAMSQQLSSLPIGGTMDFKHIPVNVKVQYPFAAKKVAMVVGGTGITPMLQALHALLGTAGDRTKVTLLYSNREQADILARTALDTWQAAYPRRLRIYHTLTREPTSSGWAGGRGRISRALLEQHLPPPSEDVLVFVCGPPAMYASLSGARGEKALGGVLAEMGYRADQVVKF